MSRTRRNFSAKFKSELVIELLKGEKDLNTIATENNIQPNLLRNWKKEFLDKASVVFDDTREDNLKEKLALERKEKAEYAKKVRQLTMQGEKLRIRYIIPYNFIICAHFNPMNSSAYDGKLERILNGILKGQSSVEEIVEAVKKMPKNNREM